MNTHRVFIAGFGGQGILLIGQMLAYAAMYEDREVTWMPSYGPEMRGGTANCTICIGDKPIASPLVSKCESLIVMNAPSMDKYEEMLVPGGTMYVNEGAIPGKPTRDDVDIHYVDANNIAKDELKSEKMASMVMLGALLRKSSLVKPETMDKVLEKVMTGKKAAFIPRNKLALNAWQG